MLLNEFLAHCVKVMKLLHFIESKRPAGFQLFLKAIANEPDHEGHRYITEFFAPFSMLSVCVLQCFLLCDYYHVPSAHMQGVQAPDQPPSLKSIADDVVSSAQKVL